MKYYISESDLKQLLKFKDDDSKLHSLTLWKEEYFKSTIEYELEIVNIKKRDYRSLYTRIISYIKDKIWVK